MYVMDVATWNVIQLGVGFFFNFFAFNSQGFIEEPVIASAADRASINKHAGYYSLSIIYATFTLANFIAAPVVGILGPKWAMVLGTLCYTVFQVGFLFLNEVYLYLSSALLGIGAAILWTGQGTYLSMNCNEKTTGRNSAMLWGLSEACLVGGGIFLFIVFHSSDTTDNIPDSTVHLLYACFTAVSIIAAVVLALLQPPVYPEKGRHTGGYGELTLSMFKLMGTKKMLLLAFVFAYTGIEQSFWTGIFPTCISFTKMLGSNTNSLLALNSICAGTGQIAGGLIFGILGDRTKKIGRDSIVFLGTCVHLLCFVGVFLNFPPEASLHSTGNSGIITPSVALALVCGGLLGFGDSVWNTQIYALLCDLYPDQSSQAFAIFKFYQSGLSCAAFFYSSKLELTWHLAIMVVTSLIAAVCFFGVERIARRSLRRSTVVVLEKAAHGNGAIERDYTDPFPDPPESATIGRTHL